MRAVEMECAQLAERVSMGEATFTEAETMAQTLGVTVRESQASLAEQRKNHQ